MSCLIPLLAVPLLDMRGPEFLQLYGTAAGVALAVLLILRWVLDPSRGLRPPALPEEIDPRELAWLRGGVEELVRLSGLELIQRGYLRYNGTRTLETTPKPPPKRHLSRPLQDMLSLAKDHPGPKELMDKTKQAFAYEDKEWRERAEAESFLLPEQPRNVLGGATTLLCVGFFGLGVIKFAYAVNHHHYNVLYLLALTVAVPWILGKVGTLPRLSARGRAYLQQAQEALRDLKGRSKALADTSDPLLVMAAAAFGLSVLNPTRHADYRNFYQPQGATSSGSSCGSGCSSSSSSGSSCSSGCGGGCGGGGCGGCGS